MATLTRAHCELILIKRLGNLLTAAGLDGTTVNGTNQDLNDPIGYAIRQLGYTTEDVAAVADADVALVPSGEYDELFDLAEFRCLDSVGGNLALVDITVGPRSERLSQLASGVQARLGSMRAALKEKYGLGAAELQAGNIELDFADHNEDLYDV